jgi:hypothetical protein
MTKYLIYNGKGYLSRLHPVVVWGEKSQAKRFTSYLLASLTIKQNKLSASVVRVYNQN